MNLSWFESIIFGFISGIAEFLPISSVAHQQIMMHLFGVDLSDPVRNFFIHTAMLIAVVSNCRSFLDVVRRESSAGYRYHHSAHQNMRTLYDWRLIRGALIPMLICMCFLLSVFQNNNLCITALFMAINGVILFLPDRMIQGNKDARSMSKFDSLLIGCSGALSTFSGISRIACTYGISVIRGAEKKSALLWSLILSIGALPVLMIFDIVALFSVSVNFWGSFFTYILSGITAYFGSCVAISAIRFLVRTKISGLAFYCWGASLFSFILYLTVG